MEEEVELDDGPNSISERRMQTPVRSAPVKRKSNIHDEEPDTKKVICGDLTDEDLDIDSLRARREDEEIVCKAVLGRDLHDVYSNKRIQVAVNRQVAEMMTGQFKSTDVAEIFSPQRVAKVC